MRWRGAFGLMRRWRRGGALTLGLCLALLTLATPAARGQDLASQLFNSLSGPQRAFFESFRAEDGLGDLRLSGGFNGAGPLGAVLQDADFAFGVGEPIFLELTPAASGQLFLFDIGASGAAKQLSPNSFGAPINLTAGVTRNVPEDRDGVTAYMGAQSSVQVWLALRIPPSTPWSPTLSGDPRLGAVQSGSSGLRDQVQALRDQGVAFSFALAVFGKDVPPLPPQDVERALNLTRDQSAQVQQALNDKGFNVGGVDGVFGGNTRRGISDWQASLGWPGTGYLNDFSLRRLLAPES